MTTEAARLGLVDKRKRIARFYRYPPRKHDAGINPLELTMILKPWEVRILVWFIERYCQLVRREKRWPHMYDLKAEVMKRVQV